MGRGIAFIKFSKKTFERLLQVVTQLIHYLFSYVRPNGCIIIKGFAIDSSNEDFGIAHDISPERVY